MSSRREFLLTSAGSAAALGAAAWHPTAVTPRSAPAEAGGAGSTPRGAPATASDRSAGSAEAGGPLAVATWPFGLQANDAAMAVLTGEGDGSADDDSGDSGDSGDRGDRGAALDAVEAGARVIEADPEIHSVGLGGYPDRDGNVTLDASIMDHTGNAGSVACLSGIVHAASVARLVMTKTPHVMLVGEGAVRFALAEGFEPAELLTPEMEKRWRTWLQESRYRPQVNWERHDTLGLLAIDGGGRLAGVCTTSGMAYKMHGRVGDSPIIGAAVYVDNEVGAACATGLGEEVVKSCGSFLVVELMRQGLDPEAACRAAVQRIVRAKDDLTDLQVGYLAIDRTGRVGAYSVAAGFSYAHHDGTHNVVVAAPSWL